MELCCLVVCVSCVLTQLQNTLLLIILSSCFHSQMLKESIQVHEQDGGSILFPAFMIQVVFQ